MHPCEGTWRCDKTVREKFIIIISGSLGGLQRMKGKL
jgi:hypothetical protein